MEENKNYSYFDNKKNIKFNYEFKAVLPITYYIIDTGKTRIHDEQKQVISEQIFDAIEKALTDESYIKEFFPQEDKIKQCYLDINQIYDEIEMYFGFITEKDADINTLKDDIKIFMEDLNGSVDYDSSVYNVVIPGTSSEDIDDSIPLDDVGIAFRPDKNKPIQITQLNSKEVENMDKELVSKGKLCFIKENNSKTINLNDEGELQLFENESLKETIPFSKTRIIRECKNILNEGYQLVEQEDTNTNTDGTPDIDVEKTKQNLEQGIKDVDELQNLKDELNDKVNNLVNEDKQEDLYVLVFYSNVNSQKEADVIVNAEGVVQDDIEEAPKYSKEKAEEICKSFNDRIAGSGCEVIPVTVAEANQLTLLNETKQIKLENLKEDPFPSTEFTQKELMPLEIHKLDCEKDLSIEQCAWIITHFDSLDNFVECLNQFTDIVSVGKNIPFISIDEYINGLLQEGSI